MPNYNCYIDESGDEGFAQGATDWFVLAGVIVDKNQDLEASHAIDEIRKVLNKPPDRPLHWKEIRRHEQRKFITQVIGGKELTIVAVGVNKRELTDTEKLKQSPALYLYASRFLLERVSWFVSANGGRVDVTFEHRGNLSYEELEAYIDSLMWDPRNQIRPVIDGISPKPKLQVKMLQVADVVAGAVYSAFQRDRFGNVEPSYIFNLKHRFYRRGRNLFSYGLKLFPHDGNRLSQDPLFSWLNSL